MRVRLLALAVGVVLPITPTPCVAQQWGPQDDPNLRTFLDRTAHVTDYDTERSPIRGRLLIRADPLPAEGDYHFWSAVLVFDGEQRSNDGHRYWQRAFGGTARCGHDQLAVDQIDLLDKGGASVVSNFVGNSSKLFAISDKDESSKIYHFVCK